MKQIFDRISNEKILRFSHNFGHFVLAAKLLSGKLSQIVVMSARRPLKYDVVVVLSQRWVDFVRSEMCRVFLLKQVLNIHIPVDSIVYL